MYQIIKELVIFILFAYLAVWIGGIVLFNLNLRSANAVVTYIEEVFLVQLSLVIWLLSLILLYVLRLLFFFLTSKVSSDAEGTTP